MRKKIVQNSEIQNVRLKKLSARRAFAASGLVGPEAKKAEFRETSLSRITARRGSRKGNQLFPLRYIQHLDQRLALVVIGLAVLVGIQFFNNARIALTVREMADQNATMIDEVGQVVEAVNILGTDLNEVRGYLLLPTHDYETTLLTAGGEAESEELGDEETLSEDVVVELFTAIQTLGQEDQLKTRYATTQKQLHEYLNDLNTLAYLEAYDLFLRNGIDYHLTDNEGVVYVTVHLTEEGGIEMTTYGGAVMSISPEVSFEEFKTSFKGLIEGGLEGERERVEQTNAARSHVYTLLTTNMAIQSTLTSKELSLSPERETTTHFVFDVLRKDGVSLASIVIDKGTAKVWMETPEDASFGSDLPYDTTDTEPFEVAVVSMLEALEGETEIEQNIAEMRATIEVLRADDGFQALLSQYGFTFTFDATETDTAFEYRLLRSDGTVLRILYIDKVTGALMIKEEGAETGSLLSSRQEAGATETLALPETLDLDSEAILSQGEFNILVAGKHGSNVDTLILTNVDPMHQKVTLISIPRDLYYNGRKINSVYADYGMDELTRQLSDITGQVIEEYILVDMYVFIDLVDMLGGIDVTLEQALIDPTYKTYDNGMASTLYYPKGEHHLSGTQALRIARSRHTTSDYSRAERQQLILMALKDKLKTLGIGDAGTLVNMVKITLDKTETNIAFDDAFAYTLRYQNFELDSGGVLSTANVLESRKLPVNFTTSLRIDICTEATVADGTCQIQYAVYTLAPKNDNWDYIKWYVGEQLKD